MKRPTDERREDQYPVSCVIEIEFPDEKDAEYISSCLNIDRGKYTDSKRIFSSEGRVLKCVILADTYRILRVSTTSVLEYLALSIRTIREFKI